MKKIALLFLFLLELNVSAQKISSSKWTDLFSYNNVLAIREDNGKLIAATENGLFFYTPATGEISKLSKANGLHEVKISAFDYNPETKIGLVGYKNGSLDVITPEGITYVVDIPVATGYTGNKTINHISITGNLAVISVGYGVSIFRLDKKEFADSAFFISTGIYQPVKEAIIKGNIVYAATSTGLKSHPMPTLADVTFPIYDSWTTLSPNDIGNLATGSVVAYSSNNQVYYGDGVSFLVLNKSFDEIQDVAITSQNIIVTSKESIFVSDLNGTEVGSLETGEPLNTGFYYNSEIYAGSKLSGMLKVLDTYSEATVIIKPDGPFNNTSYKINIVQDQVVISSGGRDSYNAPIYNNLGYYHFDGSNWNYPNYFKTFSGRLNIMDAVINPSKLNEIFFTNNTFVDGEKGIYRMDNHQYKNIYRSVLTYKERIIGLKFDEENQLFASSTSSIADSGLGKLGFYIYDKQTDSFNLVEIVSGRSVQKPLTKSGILYIPSPYSDGGDGGLVLYDYKNSPSQLSDDRVKILNAANNLPADQVMSVAVDNNDDVWIGTEKGLRIISNPSAVIDEDNPKAEPIIIEENGVGEELFRDSEILQIEVDSGNQKWVSVNGGGIFYLSSNGEKTLNQFNRANSPLPTNSVTDIKVDNTTGKVYFVTRDGVVVYQGDVLTVTENFGDVLVYPNPVVYAQYKGNVRIRGLAAKTNIRITDAAGNLVHQAVARGGSYEWNLLNHRNVRVASGIYFVLMTNEDGTDKATAKIAVVN